MPTNEPVQCPRCGAVDDFGDMRFRSGGPWVEENDGVVKVSTQLCEDCHRELIRS